MYIKLQTLVSRLLLTFGHDLISLYEDSLWQIHMVNPCENPYRGDSSGKSLYKSHQTIQNYQHGHSDQVDNFKISKVDYLKTKQKISNRLDTILIYVLKSLEIDF